MSDSASATDKPADEWRQQRGFYAERASGYTVEGWGEAEHDWPLAILLGYMSITKPASVLEIGAGSGRALHKMRERFADLEVRGIEPSAEFRAIGHRQFGFTEAELHDGDATRLPFADASFDLVTEFGVLHHIRHPERAVAEMLRISRGAVYLSDCNNYGQGGRLTRLAKQALRSIGLWRAADWVKTGGKGYSISDGDGLAYSYSVFDNLAAIKRRFSRVMVMNTQGQAVNHYRQAPTVVVLADNRPW
ncbi:MAG TPA: class I SAM-dependent methyltransferase [Vineibacter sp.]|nr:class I SAM-dependent methyltransferase [Vineibacter sp.]